MLRRALLTGAGAALVGAADAAPPGLLPQHGGLHTHALRKRLFYGAALEQAALRSDPALMAHVAAECGVVVPQTSFSWAALRPRPDRFAFDRAEIMLGYASRHGFRVRGRGLVAPGGNPDWLAAALTPETGERLLTGHIREVVGHCRRRVTQWDVVTDAIAPEDGNRFGLRTTPWFTALGPRYLDLAFHACAAADPHALRVLNEGALDYATPAQDRRRGAVLELLADLTARDVPVQALGMQAHLFGAEYRLDQRVLEKFCADVASLGLKIVITEMDIRDNELPADVTVRDHAVAAHGRAYLDAMLSNQAVLGIVTWGLSDRHTPLDQQIPRLDRLSQRPLPLDAEMRRKPLWSAMAATLEATPIRGQWSAVRGQDADFL